MAVIHGLSQKGGWSPETRKVAKTKLQEYFRYVSADRHPLIEILIGISLLDRAREHKVAKVDRKKLKDLMTSGDKIRESLKAEAGKFPYPDCKSGEEAYLRERKGSDQLRDDFARLLKKASFR